MHKLSPSIVFFFLFFFFKSVSNFLLKQNTLDLYQNLMENICNFYIAQKSTVITENQNQLLIPLTWSLRFSLLNAGKNLGATLTSFLLGVRDPCRFSWVGDSGTVVGRDLDTGSDGAVFALGRNTSAEGDNVA